MMGWIFLLLFVNVCVVELLVQFGKFPKTQIWCNNDICTDGNMECNLDSCPDIHITNSQLVGFEVKYRASDKFDGMFNGTRQIICHETCQELTVPVTVKDYISTPDHTEGIPLIVDSSLRLLESISKDAYVHRHIVSSPCTEDIPSHSVDYYYQCVDGMVVYKRCAKGFSYGPIKGCNQKPDRCVETDATMGEVNVRFKCEGLKNYIESSSSALVSINNGVQNLFRKSSKVGKIDQLSLSLLSKKMKKSKLIKVVKTKLHKACMKGKKAQANRYLETVQSIFSALNISYGCPHDHCVNLDKVTYCLDRKKRAANDDNSYEYFLSLYQNLTNNVKLPARKKRSIIPVLQSNGFVDEEYNDASVINPIISTVLDSDSKTFGITVHLSKPVMGTFMLTDRNGCRMLPSDGTGPVVWSKMFPPSAELSFEWGSCQVPSRLVIMTSKMQRSIVLPKLKLETVCELSDLVGITWVDDWFEEENIKKAVCSMTHESRTAATISLTIVCVLAFLFCTRYFIIPVLIWAYSKCMPRKFRYSLFKIMWDTSIWLIILGGITSADALHTHSSPAKTGLDILIYPIMVMMLAFFILRVPKLLGFLLTFWALIRPAKALDINDVTPSPILAAFCTLIVILVLLTALLLPEGYRETKTVCGITLLSCLPVCISLGIVTNPWLMLILSFVAVTMLIVGIICTAMSYHHEGLKLMLTTFMLLKCVGAVDINEIISYTSGELTACNHVGGITCEVKMFHEMTLPSNPNSLSLALSPDNAMPTNLNIKFNSFSDEASYVTEYAVPINPRWEGSHYTSCYWGALWDKVTGAVCNPDSQRSGKHYYNSGSQELCGCAGCGCFYCSSGAGCGHATINLPDRESFMHMSRRVGASNIFDMTLTVDFEKPTIDGKPPVEFCFLDGVVYGNYYCSNDICCMDVPKCQSGTCTCISTSGNLAVPVGDCTPCHSSGFLPFKVTKSDCDTPCYYDGSLQDVVCRSPTSDILVPLPITSTRILVGSDDAREQVTQGCYNSTLMLAHHEMYIKQVVCDKMYHAMASDNRVVNATGGPYEVIIFPEGCCNLIIQLETPIDTNPISCGVPECGITRGSSEINMVAHDGVFSTYFNSSIGDIKVTILADKEIGSGTPEKVASVGLMSATHTLYQYSYPDYQQASCENVLWLKTHGGAIEESPTCMFTFDDSCLNLKSFTWDSWNLGYPTLATSQHISTLIPLSGSITSSYEMFDHDGCNKLRYKDNLRLPSSRTRQFKIILQSDKLKLTISTGTITVISLNCSTIYDVPDAHNKVILPLTIISTGLKSVVDVTVSGKMYKLSVQPSLLQYGLEISQAMYEHMNVKIQSKNCTSNVVYLNTDKSLLVGESVLMSVIKETANASFDFSFSSGLFSNIKTSLALILGIVLVIGAVVGVVFLVKFLKA
uniref:Putative glycoprotein n=1 Tax=Beihai hermit crab virus 2 TaxID=1922389 RepID=A0A1L3KPB9_9VIRU|nr:putative glycoprotein [Beihai hermit crab virus 2]